MHMDFLSLTSLYMDFAVLKIRAEPEEWHVMPKRTSRPDPADHTNKARGERGGGAAGSPVGSTGWNTANPVGNTGRKHGHADICL
jgi:hypothetical protein